MDQFVALSFPNQARVNEAILTVKKFHARNTNSLYHSAIATKGPDGKLLIHEITAAGHGGTIVAALIGGLAGLPAGPLAVAVMAAGGAMIGGAKDFTAHEHFTALANKIVDNVPIDGALVIADVAEDSLPKFRAILKGVGGSVLDVTHFIQPTDSKKYQAETSSAQTGETSH